MYTSHDMQMYSADRELVQKIIECSEQALHECISQYQKPLFLYILRQLGDKNLAEELVQDVFIDFLEQLRDFRFQSSLKTFLFTIARNKTIDVIRKKKIKKILFSALPSYIVEGLVKVRMDEDIERKELEQKIAHVMDSLPHDYQVILRLKYVEETSVKNIATKLSLPFKATESLLFRARKAFIRLFSAY